MSAPNLQEVEQILNQHNYEMMSVLGQGGFGICLKVFSFKYRQLFACKVIVCSQETAYKMEKSFSTEMKMLSNITHRYIISIYDSFRVKNYQFMILEYCPNGDLQEYITKNGPLPKEMLYTYTIQILEALDFLADKNIAHRDIKPSNVLIDNYKRIKLADFGLGQIIPEKDYISREFAGSLAFLSPEVIQKKPFNPIEADIWAFGITLYYMAVGTYPFQITDKKTLYNNILAGIVILPNQLDFTIRKIILGALEKNPSKRMSFKEMLNLLYEKTIKPSGSEPKLAAVTKHQTTNISMIASKRIKPERALTKMALIKPRITPNMSDINLLNVKMFE